MRMNIFGFVVLLYLFLLLPAHAEKQETLQILYTGDLKGKILETKG